ncbi:MAG: single-stranded-DNA-specific exonuclease RecJ [Candidatus Schekmanbacteria bacterium]|nr:MAG: single-stranded-DNA-specific exonuclease RecJ [Candidatus Schekmanbacteria bacterium]
MKNNTKWITYPLNTQLAKKLSESLGISKITAQILINRGCDTVLKAEKFLYGGSELFYPALKMKDMGLALEKTKEACRNKEKIFLFGDYDVDGTSSVVMLLKTLKEIGAKCEYYIPRRLKEGYGLNTNAVKYAAQKGFKMIITADCGISNCKEIALARELGMSVIVLDHHLPSGELPDANAIVNPKQEDCEYPFSELSASGIVYKFCTELLGSEVYSELKEELLAFAALGTVADIAPLLDENRLIVKKGLKNLNLTSNAGLNELLQRKELHFKKIMPWHISFIIAPVINAEGRVHEYSDDVPLGYSQVVELFTSGSNGNLPSKVSSICADNDIRQDIEKRIMNDAMEMAKEEIEKGNNIIILHNDNWHPGVIGIVASKLTEEFLKPVVIIGEGGRGSARSSVNFDIYSSIDRCGKYLESYGGHTFAAGFKMDYRNLDNLKNALCEIASNYEVDSPFRKKEEIDMDIDFDEMNKELINEFDMLEPFGYGNQQPVFITRNVTVKYEPRIVGDKHLKLLLSQNGYTLQAIGFNMAEKKDILPENEYFSVIYTPQINNWNNEEHIQLKLKEIVIE